jgi:hypothetical protein
MEEFPGIEPSSQARDETARPSVLLSSVRRSSFSVPMDEEVPTIRIPTEAFMEEAPGHGVGMRRDEDIALDLMKFVAITTGYGRTASATVGFQGGGAATKPEEYAAHLLELYGKCLQALRNKK